MQRFERSKNGEGTVAENRSLRTARNRALVVLITLALASAVFFIVLLPRLLVLNNQSQSDYIAVLDGHDDNYYEGLRLLQSGIATRMFVCMDLPDVPLRGEEVQADLAFIRTTAGQFADFIDICENDEEDAFSELGNVLERGSAQRVLIVTPASESRAEYMLAQRRFPNLSWSVRPSMEPSVNVQWWRKREWADTYFPSIGHFVAPLRKPESADASVQR